MVHLTVIGTGYVGLVSGACLASLGHDVICVDTNVDKIALLAKGQVPFFEPGLEALLKDVAGSGRLRFTTDINAALTHSEAVMLAVGTPMASDGSADLSYLYAAATSVAQSLDHSAVIITKSTVPLGTGRALAQLFDKECTHPCAIASNPEFLREGSAVNDFLHPDRIVIGCDDDALPCLETLYAPLVAKGFTLIATDISSAETIKYAANAYLAMRIAYVNEMAQLCEKTGANIDDVTKGMGSDARIGPLFLNPGPGFGGSCFPKDTEALAHIAQQAGARASIIERVIESNNAHKQAMAHKISAAIAGDVSGEQPLKGKYIAILGLAFKANTDDMRDAASTVILPLLHHEGARLIAYDPEATENAKKILGDMVTYASSLKEACANADAIVILTEWPEFRELGLAGLAEICDASSIKPSVIDLRNLFDPKEAEKYGITYHSLGRATSKTEA